jgi:hypothetical protein
VNWNVSDREVIGGVYSMPGIQCGTLQAEMLTGWSGSYIETGHAGWKDCKGCGEDLKDVSYGDAEESMGCGTLLPPGDNAV